MLCEVLDTDMAPHPSNTRAALAEVAERFAAQEPIFGIEQEYTFFDGSRPLGFPEGGFPARRVATTAVSAPTRSSAGRSSRPTWRTA